jgi:hypothetical protein
VDTIIELVFVRDVIAVFVSWPTILCDLVPGLDNVGVDHAYPFW